MTENELVAALDTADRSDAVALLRSLEWKFTEIAQALDMTKNAAVSVWHRHKRRRGDR
jgi:hypothetical protein